MDDTTAVPFDAEKAAEQLARRLNEAGQHGLASAFAAYHGERNAQVAALLAPVASEPVPEAEVEKPAKKAKASK